VPATFVTLDALPLTPNGKVDRRALPPPERSDLVPDTPHVAPRTPLEEALVELWADVLEVPQVGVNDNFLELGGHSLLATRIIARVQNAFGVEIPLRVFLDAPTVAGMAIAIVQEQAARIDPDVLARLLCGVEGRSERDAPQGPPPTTSPS
jgi:acyl carrier protein